MANRPASTFLTPHAGMRCHVFLAAWTLQRSAALSRSGEANVTVDEAKHSPLGGSNRSAAQLQLGGFEDFKKCEKQVLLIDIC